MSRCVSRFVASLAAMAALVVGTASWAQFAQPGQPGPRPKSPARPGAGNYLAVPGYWVLGMEGVQTEIGLTDQQKQRLKAISDQYQAAMRKNWEGLQGLSQEEQQKKMEGQARLQVQAARKQVEAALTPEQLKTVQKMMFQLQAAGMLATPQVQEKLGLSEVQQQQLGRVYQQMQDKMQRLQREMAAQVVDVLTPEQQAALRKEAAAAGP
jgi:hypothetical protein